MNYEEENNYKDTEAPRKVTVLPPKLCCRDKMFSKIAFQ